MIFIVTSKSDITADYLILLLLEKGIPFYRFNTEDVPAKLTGAVLFPEGKFILEDEIHRIIYSEEISSIWYRRPKKSAFYQEINKEHFPYVQEDSWFFTNGLLELVGDSTVWISHPENIRKAENKIFQLKIALRCNLKIPNTVIGNSPDEVKQMDEVYKNNNNRLIVKPLRHGRFGLKEATKIFHTSVFPAVWTEGEITACPIIVQERIPKKRDIRVTIIGDQIFSVGINTVGFSDKTQLDWRRAIDEVEYDEIILPDTISNKLIDMLKIMGLSFGAFDLIETPDGEFLFLEINPNGQWAWIEQKTGLPMREAFINVLTKGP